MSLSAPSSADRAARCGARGRGRSPPRSGARRSRSTAAAAPSSSSSAMQCGSRLRPDTSSRSASRRRACRAARPIRRASRYIAATWATNVFVAATPISSPARVNSTPSASRVACEPMTFVIASTVAPALAGEAHRGERVGGLAGLRDADHEVARRRPPGRGSGTRTRCPSRPGRAPTPRSRSGRPGRRGTRCRRRRRRSAGRSASTTSSIVPRSPRSTPSGARRAVGDRLGDRVGLLVDLLEHERLVAALLGGLLVPVDGLDRPRSTRRAVGGREARRRRGATIDDLVVLDDCTSRVWARKAGIAEARNCSPSPRPTISGHSLRARDEQVGLVGGDRDERVVAARARA